MSKIFSLVTNSSTSSSLGDLPIFWVIQASRIWQYFIRKEDSLGDIYPIYIYHSFAYDFISSYISAFITANNYTEELQEFDI